MITECVLPPCPPPHPAFGGEGGEDECKVVCFPLGEGGWGGVAPTAMYFVTDWRNILVAGHGLTKYSNIANLCANLCAQG
jgi:hypothetical protein